MMDRGNGQSHSNYWRLRLHFDCHPFVRLEAPQLGESLYRSTKPRRLVVNNYTSPRYHFESVGRGYVRKNGAGSYGAGRGDRIDGSAAIAARAQLPNGCKRVVTTMEVFDEGRGGKYR
jgi:hypothetical protein